MLKIQQLLNVCRSTVHVLRYFLVACVTRSTPLVYRGFCGAGVKLHLKGFNVIFFVLAFDLGDSNLCCRRCF